MFGGETLQFVDDEDDEDQQPLLSINNERRRMADARILAELDKRYAALCRLSVVPTSSENERIREREERIVESRVDTQFRYGDLPVEILVNIFKFLDSSPAFCEGDDGSAIESNNRNNNEETKRVIARDDLKRKNELGQVCRRWRQAACKD